LPIEVIPLARAQVARALEALGGRPVLREGFMTDNGNQILDVHDLKIEAPAELESALNQLTGVVTNGLFARRPADIVLMASDAGVARL
jgi:ribose 5-phosphate isomerase A